MCENSGLPKMRHILRKSRSRSSNGDTKLDSYKKIRVNQNIAQHTVLIPCTV